ncbi:hypothetical protein [Halalkalicoccus tibetensis]|uniref:Uncharacterized protein n=1 Tax=Halalkalicoccus tibetensis TaxID=175632 RepID=A0ABD5V0V0_9EURY
MEIAELWNVLVVGLAVGVGVVLIEVNPVAAICLVAYGLLVAVTSFTNRYEDRVEEHAGALTALQMLLLAVALIALYV